MALKGRVQGGVGWEQAPARHRGREVTMNEGRSEWQSPHLKAGQRLDGSGSKNKCKSGDWKRGGPEPPDIRDDNCFSTSLLCCL